MKVLILLFFFSFPNPFHGWHWPWHKCQPSIFLTVPTQDSIDQLHSSPFSFSFDDSDCIKDGNAWWFIGDDDTIAYSTLSCDFAKEYSHKMDPPVHTFHNKLSVPKDRI